MSVARATPCTSAFTVAPPPGAFVAHEQPMMNAPASSASAMSPTFASMDTPSADTAIHVAAGAAHRVLGSACTQGARGLGEHARDGDVAAHDRLVEGEIPGHSRLLHTGLARRGACGLDGRRTRFRRLGRLRGHRRSHAGQSRARQHHGTGRGTEFLRSLLLHSAHLRPIPRS